MVSSYLKCLSRDVWKLKTSHVASVKRRETENATNINRLSMHVGNKHDLEY